MIVSKVMANKVIERAFDKEASVFGKWRQDTASSLNSAFAEDIKLWKGYRFIKSDDDVSVIVTLSKVVVTSSILCALES